jgi:predicted ABC-type ATPase
MTLVDEDPILTPTLDKKTVDTFTDDFMFSNPLRHLLDSRVLPQGEDVNRGEYRQALADHLTQSGIKGEKPALVFTGGGYGAGKTSGLQWLVAAGKSPVNMPVSALQGVDYCKQLLPEFSQVQRVADGRASEICQEESRTISDMLFGQLVTEKRTFGWDSSMSDKEKTFKKIEFARKNGYRIVLLAVLTRLEIAIPRAMQRAKETRRFAPPKYLESSHRAFWAHLPDYSEAFDEVLVLENSREKKDGGPSLLAIKTADEINMKIFDRPTYEDYTSNVTDG